MLEGQRRFLADFAGPCDGRAGERFCRFVHKVLGSGKGKGVEA